MTHLPLAGSRICVTGGTGFLGSHLLSMLVAGGADVTCIVRPGSASKNLPAGVNKNICDCADAQGVTEALRGKDIVIHMAGLLFGTGWRDYMDANANCAQNIAARLRDSSTHLIFVSSLAAAGSCANPAGLDENCVPAPVSAYGWSKFMCERIFESRHGKRLTILRPPIIYGSGDRGLLPLFKSAKRGIAVSPGMGRKFPVSIIHASDMARAIVLACSRPIAATYHLNDGATHDMDSFCQAMGKALGKDKILVVHPPLPLMAATAAASTAWGAMIGAIGGKKAAAPHWNFDKYREAREPGWVANANKIRVQLGFEPEIGLDAGMAEAVAGYRQRGWL